MWVAERGRKGLGGRRLGRAGRLGLGDLGANAAAHKVQNFVGSGFYGHFDGQGAFTMFNYPSAIVTDSSSNFFVLDTQNYRIRKVTGSGAVTLIAPRSEDAVAKSTRFPW